MKSNIFTDEIILNDCWNKIEIGIDIEIEIDNVIDIGNVLKRIEYKSIK